MTIKHSLLAASLLFTFSVPSMAEQECRDMGDGSVECTDFSDNSYYDDAVETIQETYQEWNDTDGDSDMEQITDDPYWD